EEEARKRVRREERHHHPDGDQKRNARDELPEPTDPGTVSRLSHVRPPFQLTASACRRCCDLRQAKTIGPRAYWTFGLPLSVRVSCTGHAVEPRDHVRRDRVADRLVDELVARVLVELQAHTLEPVGLIGREEAQHPAAVLTDWVARPRDEPDRQ